MSPLSLLTGKCLFLFNDRKLISTLALRIFMKQFFSSFHNCTYLFFVMSVFFITLFSSQPGKAELVDKIVAVVNDDVITLSEVEEESAGLYRSLAQKNEGESLFQALREARETTLNAMISRLLINQKAKQVNVAVSDKEIDAAYETMRTRASLPPA